MQYRKDSRSGNELSALGFGCMRFPGGAVGIDMEKTEKLLLRAFEGGVNYYDTAYTYSGSEKVLGEILEKNGLREKVYVATKLPQAICRSASDFDRFFDTQKKRLRTGYVDYYLIHNITDFAEWEKLISFGINEWISAKKKNGEIRQIGFSFHGPQHDFTKTLDVFDWDFAQIQYNYINTRYQAGTEGMRYAASKGIPVIVMEPLLGGKLSNLSREAASILQKAHLDSSASGLALKWIWNDPDVTLLLSGMNQVAQLEENLKLAEIALPGSLTEAELKTIEDIKTVFNKNFKIPCTSCNYCMPCPKKINISDCFEAYNNSFAFGRGAGMFQYLSSTGFLSEIPHFARDCAQCGECESRCPQQIEIRKQLKIVRRRLEFPGMKILRSLAMKIIRR